MNSGCSCCHCSHILILSWDLDHCIFFFLFAELGLHTCSMESNGSRLGLTWVLQIVIQRLNLGNCVFMFPKSKYQPYESNEVVISNPLY